MFDCCCAVLCALQLTITTQPSLLLSLGSLLTADRSIPSTLHVPIINLPPDLSAALSSSTLARSKGSTADTDVDNAAVNVSMASSFGHAAAGHTRSSSVLWQEFDIPSGYRSHAPLGDTSNTTTSNSTSTRQGSLQLSKWLLDLFEVQYNKEHR